MPRKKTNPPATRSLIQRIERFCAKYGKDRLARRADIHPTSLTPVGTDAWNPTKRTIDVLHKAMDDLEASGELEDQAAA